MDAGDYLLISGVSVRILRVNDRFVVLDSGHKLPLAQAERYKCSSDKPDSVLAYTQARRLGRTHITKQLKLI